MIIKNKGLKKIAFGMLVACLSGCALPGSKTLSIIMHNDTVSTPLHGLYILSDRGQVLMKPWPPSEKPLEAKSYKNWAGIDVRRMPKYFTVRWKESPQGEIFERKLILNKPVDRSHDGKIFVSLLNDRSVALSWDQYNRKGVKTDCGGYIFETYYEKASPLVEKGIAEWRDYHERKRAHLASGNPEPFQNIGYFEKNTEAAARCNFLFYIGRKSKWSVDYKDEDDK